MPRLEALLEQAVAVLEDRGASALDAFLAARPADASVVRGCLRELQQLGLVAPATAADVRPRPLPAAIGGHEVMCRLGGGAMGSVFLVREPGTRRLVALKTLRLDVSGDDRIARFRREIEAIARLQHPGIAALYQVGDSDGLPFFTMEWVLGASLAQVVDALRHRAPAQLQAADMLQAVHRVVAGAEGGDRGDPLQRAPLGRSWRDACLRIVLQAAEALAHAHTRGVLHRDIKGSNLLLDLEGRVRIVDFGLAHADGAARLTLSGTQIGSLPFMAPEMLQGRAPHDARSDVYALGVVLYQLLTLRLPYEGDDAEGTRRLILAAQLSPLRLLNPSIDVEVETVCQVALAPEPAHRYASMTAFATDLRALLEHRPVAVRRPSLALGIRRWMRRRPVLATALLLLGLVVVVVPTLFGILQTQHARRVVLLTDPDRARSLVEAERRLWPSLPERVPEMKAWLAELQELAERRPLHEARLGELRATALRRAGSNALRQAEIDAQLAELRAGLRYAEEYAGVIYPRLRLVHDPLIDEREWEQREVLSFELANPSEARELFRVARLLRDLDLLAALRQKIIERIDWAETVEERSLRAHAAAWERAIAAVAESKPYGNLRLRPVLGLVPLGADPASGLQEFAHLASGAPAMRDAQTQQLVITEATGIVLVLLAGGKFAMGATRAAADLGPNNDPAAQEDESPVHELELAPFFLGKHEVTQAQWLRLVPINPSRVASRSTWPGNPRPVSPLHPVEGVTWYEGNEVARRWGLELPTEAQWEYAARGGTTTPWFWGTDPDQAPEFANLSSLADGWYTHAPVGSLRANCFGLHDTVGNVAEWCRDPHERYLGTKFPAQSPTGAQIAGIDAPRCLRGAGARDGIERGRSSARASRDPTERQHGGMRLSLRMP